MIKILGSSTKKDCEPFHEKLKAIIILAKSLWIKSRVMVEELIQIIRRNVDMIDKGYTQDVLIITGRRLIAKEQYSLAKKCFKEAYALSPPEEHHETLFLYLWPDILSKQYYLANKTISEFDLHGKFLTLSSQLKFWTAYVSEMMGKIKLAQHYYDLIIRDNPISFYAIMSLKKLKNLSQNENHSIIDSEELHRHSLLGSRKNIPFKEYSPHLLNSLKRIKIFTVLNQTSLLNYESQQVINAPISKLLKNYSIYPTALHKELREQITFQLAHLLHQGENYLKSFSLIYNEMQMEKNSINPELLKDPLSQSLYRANFQLNEVKYRPLHLSFPHPARECF